MKEKNIRMVIDKKVCCLRRFRYYARYNAKANAKLKQLN